MARCFDGAAVMSPGPNATQANVMEWANYGLIHWQLCTSIECSADLRGLKECKVCFCPPQLPHAFFSRCLRCTQAASFLCGTNTVVKHTEFGQYSLWEMPRRSRFPTYWTIMRTRTLYVVLADWTHIWMNLSFAFCVTHLMGFLWTKICFLQ